MIGSISKEAKKAHRLNIRSGQLRALGLFAADPKLGLRRRARARAHSSFCVVSGILARPVEVGYSQRANQIEAGFAAWQANPFYTGLGTWNSSAGNFVDDFLNSDVIGLPSPVELWWSDGSPELRGSFVLGPRTRSESKKGRCSQTKVLQVSDQDVLLSGEASHLRAWFEPGRSVIGNLFHQCSVEGHRKLVG